MIEVYQLITLVFFLISLAATMIVTSSPEDEEIKISEEIISEANELYEGLEEEIRVSINEMVKRVADASRTEEETVRAVLKRVWTQTYYIRKNVALKNINGFIKRVTRRFKTEVRKMVKGMGTGPGVILGVSEPYNYAASNLVDLWDAVEENETDMLKEGSIVRDQLGGILKEDQINPVTKRTENRPVIFDIRDWAKDENGNPNRYPTEGYVCNFWGIWTPSGKKSPELFTAVCFNNKLIDPGQDSQIISDIMSDWHFKPCIIELMADEEGDWKWVETSFPREDTTGTYPHDMTVLLTDRTYQKALAGRVFELNQLDKVWAQHQEDRWKFPFLVRGELTAIGTELSDWNSYSVAIDDDSTAYTVDAEGNVTPSIWCNVSPHIYDNVIRGKIGRESGGIISANINRSKEKVNGKHTGNYTKVNRLVLWGVWGDPDELELPIQVERYIEPETTQTPSPQKVISPPKSVSTSPSKTAAKPHSFVTSVGTEAEMLEGFGDLEIVEPEPEPVSTEEVKPKRRLFGKRKRKR